MAESEAQSDAGLNTIRFLRDEPATSDFFGSHERLAKMVASVLEAQPELKVIGLLGRWGSGKSTVIRFIKAAVEKDSSARCFTYDAWVHQNDPPRRAFLEALINYLHAEGISQKENWADLLGDIAGRQSVTETTTDRKLMPAGWIILASLVLAGLSVPLLGFDTVDAAFGPMATPFGMALFRLAMLLLSLPLLTGLAVYLYWRPWAWPLPSDFLTNHRGAYRDRSILAVFMNRAVEKERQRTIRTIDPTAIEFQDMFRKVASEIAKRHVRIVVVIDNLDRLPEPESVAMWGTIRSLFFDSDGAQPLNRSASTPTVLVPLDPDALRRMYKVTHGEFGDELASSFVDKTFDLTFHVTRPVPSDWRAYLSDRLKTVFGGIISDDFIYWTTVFYEALLESDGSQISAVANTPKLETTPRKLNILSNDIAATWTQCKELGVSYYSAAYFCVFRDMIEADIYLALNGPKGGIERLDPDWQRNVAAIHFGARPEIAAQIILDQPVREAIREGREAEFQAYAATPGFQQVLLKVLERPPHDPGPRGGFLTSFTERAAVLLDDLNPPPAPWVSVAWRLLVHAMRNAAPWSAVDESTVVAMRAFLENSPPDLRGNVVTMMSARLSGLVGPLSIETAPEPVAFGACIKLLLEFCQTHSLDLPDVVVPEGAAGFLEVFAACTDADIRQHIRPSVGESELAGYLAQAITDGTAPDEIQVRLMALREYAPKVPLKGIIDAAGRVLENPQKAGAVTSALSCLGALRTSSKEASARIEQVVSSGNLTNRLNELDAGRDGLGLSMALALFLLSASDVPRPSNDNWSRILERYPDLPKAVSDHIFEFDGEENTAGLVQRARQAPDAMPIIKAILSYRIHSEHLGNLPVRDVILQLPRYLALLDDDDQKSFLDEFGLYNNVWNILLEVGNEASAIRLVTSQLNDDAPHKKEALNYVRTRVEQTSADGWREGVVENTPFFKMVTQAATLSKPPFKVGTPLADALRALIPEVLATADVVLRDRWFEAALMLRSVARKALLQNMRDHIDNGAAVADLPLLLRANDDLLLTHGGFDKRPDDSIRHVVEPLLGSSEGTALLQARAADVARWVAAASSTARHNLAGRVFDLLKANNADDAQSKVLIDLRSEWMLPEDPETEEPAE